MSDHADQEKACSRARLGVAAPGSPYTPNARGEQEDPMVPLGPEDS